MLCGGRLLPSLLQLLPSWATLLTVVLRQKNQYIRNGTSNRYRVIMQVYVRVLREQKLHWAGTSVCPYRQHWGYV
jgi:hypothetical protein